MKDSIDISIKKRLEYIDHIETLVDNFFDSLEENSQKPTEKNDQQKLIDNFIASADPKAIQENDQADIEIQKIWQDLRQKMLEHPEKQAATDIAKTTKRYVKKFLKDIQPKESSKIKLSKEEEEKLKLFSKLK